MILNTARFTQKCTIQNNKIFTLNIQKKTPNRKYEKLCIAVYLNTETIIT